jgi:ADP-heptose:LPS heptosyltransferase
MMEIRKICILHLNQIGDLLFSLPLLKALRENYPESAIHSVIRPHLGELLAASPYIGKLLFRKRGVKPVLELLKEIRHERYDILISLSRSEECLFLAAFSRAKVKVGFAHFPWDYGLDVRVEMGGPPSWLNNFMLLKRMGVDVKKRDYVGLVHLPCDEREWAEGRYVVISAGTSARRRSKTWQEEKFAELSFLLKETYGLNTLLVGGADCKEISNKVMERVREKNRGTGHVQDWTGKTTLEDLCCLLRKATLFVGVDSGIMHLASSFDVPVVGIFGPSDPLHVGPQNQKSRVVREDSLDCVPCYQKSCKDRDCLRRLDVKRVFDACEELLRK